MSVFGIGDEQYLESVRKNTWRGLYGRVLQGKVVYLPRYGYTTDEKGKLVIKEEEAEVVRRIYDLYLAGFGFKKIAEILNRDGISSPSGMKWTQNGVREILTSPLYKGKLVWNRYEYFRVAGVSDKRKRVQKPPSEWVVQKRPELAIVSEKVWEKARRIREGRKTAKMENKQIGGKPALFSSFITCECGKKFIKQYRNTYRCNGFVVGACDNSAKLREDALIDLVSAGIRKFLTERRGELIGEVRNLVKKRFSGRDRKEIKREIKERRDKLEKTLSLLERYPSEALASKVKELEEGIKGNKGFKTSLLQVCSGSRT